MPEAARRPGFTPVEALVYFMPRRGDGDVVVMLCLRDEELEKLREDEEWVRYAVYVG